MIGSEPEEELSSSLLSEADSKSASGLSRSMRDLPLGTRPSGAGCVAYLV